MDDDLEELPIDLMPLSATDRAHVLIEALIQNFQLVTIELEAEDDAQVIFETLNARGEPLTPSDLVRNFVFLTATRQKQDVEKLYLERWQQYEEVPANRPFWKQDERQGRLRRPRMDLFLFHYVTFKTGEELKIGHLYQAFKDWWDEKSDRTIDIELIDLEKYSKIYRNLLDPERGRFGQFAHRFRVLDTTTVYPLILWLAGELGEESAEFLDTLTALESYVIRRMVCGLTQKAYNRLFLSYLSDLRNSQPMPIPNRLRQLLSASTAETAVGQMIGNSSHISFRIRRITALAHVEP